jgi:hypothetical protein
VVVALEHPVFLVRVALLFMVLDLAVALVVDFTAAVAVLAAMRALVVRVARLVLTELLVLAEAEAEAVAVTLVAVVLPEAEAEAVA